MVDGDLRYQVLTWIDGIAVYPHFIVEMRRSHPPGGSHFSDLVAPLNFLPGPYRGMGKVGIVGAHASASRRRVLGRAKVALKHAFHRNEVKRSARAG